jgi:hypothetical protein
MLATKVVCPHCQKHLKMSKPMTPGHRVLCPRCGRSFPVPTDTPVEVKASQPGHQTNHVPRPTEITDRRPLSPSDQDDGTKLASAGRQKIIIGAILGGLLLLLTVTFGLVLFVATRKVPEDNTVETAISTPASDAIPSPPSRSSEVPPPPPEQRQEPEVVNESRLVSTETADEPKQESWLPPEEQARVNKAIEAGVQWMKRHQRQDGSWEPRPGLAALPALTLLECGVPNDDIRIQKALHFVRRTIPGLNQTYDLALCILFLDRLGDPADKKLIQTCALRLAAGQKTSGGWTYDCPILSNEQEDDLLTVMRSRAPRDALDLFVGGKDGSAPPGFLARDPNDTLDKGIAGTPSADPTLLPKDRGTMPLQDPGGANKTLEMVRPSPEATQLALDRLPKHLQQLPSLQPPKDSHKLPRNDRTDNSNTQFAILGLLAAKRHGVPLERVYALIVHRFHRSQVADGRWNYNFTSPAQSLNQSPAMTGAGLLGLAVQYGLAADRAHPNAKPKPIDDPAVEKGFHYLAQFIGKPIGWKKTRARNREPINLYFLWTVERCGVLYNRRQIEGKDWYSWGAELLLDHQKADGVWFLGNYPGSQPITDTCFALLFLKRANLAKELTKKVEFFTVGKKLQRSP